MVVYCRNLLYFKSTILIVYIRNYLLFREKSKKRTYKGMNDMDNKELEEIQQLKRAIKELQEGRAESATTATFEQRVKAPKLFGSLYKVWGIKIILILALLVLIAFGVKLVFSGSAFKQESTIFVEHIQELATLATAEAHMKHIIEQEDNILNLPGTKRELLLVVPATVIAGVDLKGISPNDIKVNEKEKKLEIVLPHAAFIQEPAIQMDKVIAFSDEGLFRGEPEWAEGYDLAAKAQEEIKEEAINIGLLETAEKNAEKVLKEFFSNLGYSVEISFK